jgi:hypothetical protein
MSTMSSLAGTPVEGAVALVTGGHRGFGRAVVDDASVAAAPQAAPHVSIVVNNAGVLLQAPVLGA